MISHNSKKYQEKLLAEDMIAESFAEIRINTWIEETHGIGLQTIFIFLTMASSFMAASEVRFELTDLKCMLGGGGVLESSR